MPWAILIRRDNRLDGKVEFLAGNGFFGRADSHPCRTALFETRSAARSAIREHLGNLHLRPDLRAEPHGWLAPIPVPVTVEVRRTSTPPHPAGDQGATADHDLTATERR